jgi:hypothetical protein
MDVDPGTTFLLCSDGITRHIDDHELGELLTAGTEPELLCQQLKEICYSRGAEDNLTAVIVRTADRPESAKTAHPSQFDDEETVATARTQSPGSAEDAGLETIPSISLDAATELAQEPEGPETVDDADTPYDEVAEPEVEVLDRIFGEREEYVSSSVVVPAAEPEVEEREFALFGQTAESEVIPEVPPVKTANSLVKTLLFLLIGGLLGVGGSYLWGEYAKQQQQAEPEPPPQLVAKTDDIARTALEESRQLVDKDPAAYIDAKAASARDAADHYILGRAWFLAGRDFEEAESCLLYTSPSPRDRG